MIQRIVGSTGFTGFTQKKQLRMIILEINGEASIAIAIHHSNVKSIHGIGEKIIWKVVQRKRAKGD